MRSLRRVLRTHSVSSYASELSLPLWYARLAAATLGCGGPLCSIAVRRSRCESCTPGAACLIHEGGGSTALVTTLGAVLLGAVAMMGGAAGRCAMGAGAGAGAVGVGVGVAVAIGAGV